MKTGCMPVLDADEAEGQEKAACFFVFWLRDREGLTASAVQNRV